MELYRMYLSEEPYADRVRALVQAAFLRGQDGRLTYQTSKELYGEVMEGSVTRLEQFAACAFAHFATYGLRLTQRELYGVKPTDLGIIFHRAMELFSRKLQNSDYDWRTAPQDWQAETMEQCVDEITEEYGAGVLHGSAREEYTIRRVKRILCRAIWALHEQIMAGSFTPTSFEVSFADAGNLEAVNVRLDSQAKLHLQGRIDRIDTADTEDTVYVKIVDYKSGTAKFDPVSLYYGLQLQLVVYLNAALEMERRMHRGKEVVPAGIFYYHLDDPVLEKEADTTDEEMREKLLKKLRPDGVLNSDGEILHLLDRNLGGDSLVIPAGLKKDGSLKAASSAVSTQQFEQLSGYVSKKMKEMTEEILQGEVSARPYANRTGSACDFCEYADVCGFDRKIPDMCFRRLPELKKDEVWEKFAEALEDGYGSEMDE
jgi:ATP-dependent helicase/nuclease subunit B